jgi:hypothetical protein
MNWFWSRKMLPFRIAFFVALGYALAEVFLP